MPTTLAELQSASSSKLIAYDQAEVVPGFVNGTYFLHVSGTAPCFNMEVQLLPRIYVRCPEHWAIEVTGTLIGGFCLERVKPFNVTIPLAGVIGSEGIEVVGDNKSEQFPVEGGCS
jgi:hypothetical protein